MQEKLVDTGKAAEIAVSVPAWHDPSILSFTATTAPGTSPEQVRDAMRSQIAAALRDGFSAAELSRAKARIAASASLERDGVFSEIRAVSEALAAGDWTFAYSFDAAVEKLTLARINAAAKKYLVPAGETTGILIDTL
jgi:zinc protease